MANQGWLPLGPHGPPAPQWGALQQPMAAGQFTRPSVGQVYDLWVQLSPAEQGQFMALISGTPGAANQAAIPQGYTRNPRTGTVYRMNVAMQHTAGRAAVEEATQRAAQELKQFSSDNGITVVNGNAVVPPGLTQALRAQYAQLQQALIDAKLAKTNYAAAHPDEFRAPPTAGNARGRGAAIRGNRGGRGRGRGNAP